MRKNNSTKSKNIDCFEVSDEPWEAVKQQLPRFQNKLDLDDLGLMTEPR